MIFSLPVEKKPFLVYISGISWLERPIFGSIIKHEETFQTGKTGTQHHSSAKFEGLFFFTPYKFHIWKQESSFLSLGTNTGRKQRGISSGHRRWICFIQESKPWLYTKWDWVCPDMLCVCVPLFITSNTFSALCQYCASSLMQLNSVTATGALSPGATVSDLQSRCILSHLGAHH